MNRFLATGLITCLFMVVACEYRDPHTLNIKPPISEVGKNENSRHKMGDGNKRKIYDFTLFDIDAQPTSLSKFRGKVLLIVNTASRCGYTPQYEQLQEIYERYQVKGLEILAFPSNDFGGQELETNEQVANFCYTRYSVDFPLFAKTKVRGDNKHPLYRFLVERGPYKGEVRWNFEKFLVDGKGSVIGRYHSSMLPLSEEIISDVERAITFSS